MKYLNELYLNELTTDELKKVYENNKGIRDIAFNLYSELIWGYVEEYTSEFDGRYVSIYFDSYDHPIINVKDTYSFIDGLKSMQYKYGAFAEEEAKKITDFEILFDSLADYDYDSDEYTDCETKIELAERELVDILTKILRDELDCMYVEDDIIEYFVECIDLNDDYADIYVDDDFVAYETITKCYK